MITLQHVRCHQCTQSPDTHDDESRLCLSIVTQILLNLGDLSINFSMLCRVLNKIFVCCEVLRACHRGRWLALKQTLVNFRYQKLIREFSVTSHFMGINPRNHFCGHTIITSIGRQCLGVTQDKCVDCKVAELSHCPCWPNCSVSAGHLVFAVNISRCMSPCLHNCLVIGYCFLLRTCNFSQIWKLYSNGISARYCDVTCWMAVARYFKQNL